MKKALALLLVRLVVSVYAAIQIFALVNHVSMGIDSSHWAATGLKNTPSLAAFIGLLISVGGILTFLGLFNRLGAVLLLCGFAILAFHFPYPFMLRYVPFILLTIPLILWGNGAISLDRAIGGGK